MNKEINFRGLSLSGDWYYGNLTILTNNDHVSHDKGSYISNPGGSMPFNNQVRPETVSHYTRLRDKNGKEIYEGDIFSWLTIIFPIAVNHLHGYRFMFGKDQLNGAIANEGKIIGNIYE